MQVTDLGNREEGKLWPRKPTAASKGILVTLTRSTSAHQNKRVRFLQVAFDTTGDAFLIGDHHGNIYVCEIIRNRFKLVQKTGQACTALAFTLRRTSEFLVALADYSIKCYDKDTKQMVSWMRGHEGAVSSLSVHSSGRYAVSTSSDAAQLWDLDTFQRKRKLNVSQPVGIQKVMFLPLTNTILSCFSDDSIFAWESDTLTCRYQLPVPQDGTRMHYRTFAVTQDGKTLAAAGRSALVHLWCLDARTLLRILQMPPQVRSIRHVEYLPDSFDGGSSQVLGVLSQDGVMRFIHVQTCKQLFQIGSHDEAISSAAVCPKGRHVAALMDSGAVRIYDVRALTQEINKPPQSLVKAVTQRDQGNISCVRVKVQTGTVQRPTRASGGKVRTRILRPPAGSTQDDNENDLPGGLNKKRLQVLLKTSGEYPAKYRMFIWRSLLCLPENQAAFSSLTEKGLHAAYVSLPDRYPIKTQKLQRGLQRLLSAMAHWSAIFGEVEYLPLLAFPFVKLFQNNPLICFETLATVIANWCQHWFEYFPNPPLNILSMVENVLAHHDNELLRHFVDHAVTSQLYAWPLLETLFSEVLTRDEWLRLFDNVFSNHPAFLLMAVVAYVTCCRAPLLLCTHRDDFEYFFHHRNNMDVGAMLKEAHRLMETTPADLHPGSMLSDFQPLTRPQYPVFNKYPTFIVEYQCRERERIRQQEVEYLRERQVLEEMKAEAVRQQAEDETWFMQQELLQKAEEQRRRILQDEENKLLEQRARLAAMKRELKVKEVTLLDATRRRFLKQQQNRRRTELKRLDDKIQRQTALREQETVMAVQDLEVRQMELDSQRRLFEQQLMREQEHMNQQLRAEVEVRRRKTEEEDSALQDLLQTDTHLSHEAHRVLEGSLAEAEQLALDAEWQTEVIRKLKRAEEEAEKRRERLTDLSRETHTKEEELIQLMMSAKGVQCSNLVNKRADLEKEKRSGSAKDRNVDFIAPEMEDNIQHQNQLRRSQEESRRGLLLKPTSLHTEPTSSSLSSPSSFEDSTSVSLNRARGTLDREERELLQEVRALRQKLAARARDATLHSATSQDS